MATAWNRDGLRATGFLCLSALWMAILVGSAAGQVRAFAVVLAAGLSVAGAARLLLAPILGWDGGPGVRDEGRGAAR